MVANASVAWEALTVEYADVITAQLWGHSHRDQVSLFRAPNATTAVAVNYIAPSLQPDSINPSVRFYVVDADTASIIDYDACVRVRVCATEPPHAA